MHNMKNYYFDRDKNKKISGLFARPQFEGQEFLPETDKEIINFFKKQAAVQKANEENEQKIQAKMRKMAIDVLKADKELPSDFEG